MDEKEHPMDERQRGQAEQLAKLRAEERRREQEVRARRQARERTEIKETQLRGRIEGK